jgi:hypothetical protein
VRIWRDFIRGLRRDWKPAACCGGGGALGALFGWGVSGGNAGAAGAGAAAGAILGAFFFALIE